MIFNLSTADKVKIFPTKEKADLVCPSNIDAITYQSVFSARVKGWVVQRRHADQVTGYLEEE